MTLSALEFLRNFFKCLENWSYCIPIILNNYTSFYKQLGCYGLEPQIWQKNEQLATHFFCWQLHFRPQAGVATEFCEKKVQIYIKLYKKCVVVYKYAFVVVGVG